LLPKTGANSSKLIPTSALFLAIGILLATRRRIVN
jgi:LPXTG-motif cell wall-anchored protein